MNAKTRNRLDFFLNLAILLSTAAAVGYYFVSGPDVLGSTGSGCLKYFTTDSNILAAIASAVFLFYNVKRWNNPAYRIPHAVLIFKFVGTVSVALTFLTVLFFLAPVGCASGGAENFFFFFAGNVFVLHFSTPVLAILSFVLFEREREVALSRRTALWGLLPTVVYSVVYLVLVVFVKVWTDWYGFTFGGKLYVIPFSMIAMYVATFGIAAALLWLRRGKKKTD